MSTTGNVAASSASSATSANQATQTKSNTLDKNAFIKILMAEISNQDPTGQSSDPTQYVSQLAQYSSLEQMTNLNSTMTLSGASNLIGVNVEFNQTDSSGKNVQGIVKSISKNGDNITLNVEQSGSTATKPYKYSDIITINPDPTTTAAKATSDSSAATTDSKAVASDSAATV